MADAVVITGVGVLTGLGQTAQSHAAMRAGFARITEWEDLLLMGPDEEWDPPTPMRASAAAIAWAGVPPRERLVTVALPALDEALASAQLTAKDWKDVSLHLALRAPVAPATIESFGAGVVEDLHVRGGLAKAAATRVVARGHASGALAIQRAAAEVASGERKFAVVGAVDGFSDMADLERLDKTFRLRSERAADGYMPGEAAVFLVLEEAGAAKMRGATALARIGAIGLAEEPHPLGDTTPTKAEGLCEAIRAALGTKRPAAKPWLLSDQNGERHRAKEWALALVRLDALVGGEHELWFPAQSFGDAGVASVPLAAAMACEAFARELAPAPAALLLSSSDGPERAAMLLHAVKGA
ncbi:MAG: hypothetical protein KAY61_05325 [Candidatus Eisenbacteria bacterium]|nr:hypothetical protein [Candidatus Eisenbacteria bacterium]